MGEKLSVKDNKGETPLDDYSGLKLDYVRTQQELADEEFANYIKAVYKYVPMFSGYKRHAFTFEILMQIHYDMFCDVWDWAGKIRRRGLNLGIEPYKIRPELQKLVGDYEYWISKKWDPIEISARLHHRLVWIHPFPNGNGRWARFVAGLNTKQEINKFEAWPIDQLSIESDFRKKYIDALKKADQGDCSEMIQIHREFLA